MRNLKARNFQTAGMAALARCVLASGALILGFAAVSPSANANVGDAYGFGSRTTALGGAGAAWGAGAFSAYYNPAQLGLRTQERLKLDYGLVFMQPSFKAIQNVVTQNKFVSDAQSTGDVDTSYRNTLGQELAVSYRLLPEFQNITLGLVTFFPLDAVAYMDTGEAYVPEYVLYRARTQRPQVEFGVGGELFKGIHLGAGLHLALNLTSNASIFLNTKNNTTSTMRFTSSVKPKVGPYFGAMYTHETEAGEKNFSLGAVYRAAVSSDNTMVLNSAARVFGDFAAVDFNFTALSALYYDPATVELGGSWQALRDVRLYGQLEYQVWHDFQAPVLVIKQPQTTNCVPSAGNPCPGGTVTISPGQAATFSYRNIWVPRAGGEWNLSPFVTLRVGYAYRPSIFSSLPTESGNYLDPAKHMANLGVGLNFKSFLGFEVANRIDINASYHYLLPDHVTKTAGNEVGDSSDSKVGAPGYDIGGQVYGGGATLSLAF